MQKIFHRRHWWLFTALTMVSVSLLAKIIWADFSVDLRWFLLVVGATFISEDLTTTSVGVMVGQGQTNFWFGTLACFAGIFIGDVLLYLAGKLFGKVALERIPLRWFLNAEAVEKSSAWFEKQGSKVIFISRFVPGMRLPTYFAAGMLNTNFASFVFYFALACAIWTPLLIGLSAWFGAEVIQYIFFGQKFFALEVLLSGLLLLVAVKFLLRMLTWRGRRILLGKLRQWTHWEFWSLWCFYPPIIAYIAYLACKYRSLTLFTASNPAIPASGFVGESKTQILNGLQSSAKTFIADYQFIPSADDVATRISQAKMFMVERQQNFPIVLKPDVGQRGEGVQVIRSDEEMKQYFQGCASNVIVQEYIAGSEFGVFYYRFPNEERGQIFSITEKKFPVVIGDGKRTLEELILADERAICMAQFYLDKQGERTFAVPQKDEQVQLVEIGSHCRGAIFLDGIRYKTEVLKNTIDRISKGYDGFYFGRFDIRVPDLEAFVRGENFKIIELNGVTSEATHVYDPKNSLFTAYRVLFAQWRIAFEIGAQNKSRGVNPVSIRELFQDWERPHPAGEPHNKINFHRS
jgi:membrane protein DedA with SNARE-associated domain